jgi:hypothetical protein
MALRDRIAALKLMNRSKQHEMETLGATLAGLRAAEKELEDQSALLCADALREATQSTEDTRIFLPAYLKSVETRQRSLTDERAVTAEKAALAEEKLFQSFRESKTTEQVLRRATNELALEDARAMTAEMDDAGRALFLLKRNGQMVG